MKQKLLKTLVLLCALIVGSATSWAETDVTINFGTTSGYWYAHGSNDTFEDSDSRTWTREYTAGGKASGGPAYSQFGNSSNTCTSLIFTATAGSEFTLTKFSVTMEGASATTAGTIYLYKRTSGGTETQLASQVVSGNASVTCSISSSQTFSSTDILKVSYVGTAKAIKVTTLSYSYTAGSSDPVAVTGVSLDEASLDLTVGGNATLTAIVAPANATNKNVTWESSNPSVATVDGDGVVTAVAVGSATITVTTEDGNYTETCAVTVSEAKDYVTLPFNWEGGVSSDFTSLEGVTASGLGSDYAAGNAPYRVKFDTTGDYIQIKTDSQIGKVSIDVKMIGGATASSITVQESTDGETFTDVETLSISGSQNDILSLETTNSFAAASRYVRLSFTKGSNVGVGPISIEKGVTISSAGFATLFTPAALNFSGVDGLTAYTAAKDGDVVRLTKVSNVQANTGVVLEGNAGTYSIPAIATSSTAKGELTGNATEATAWNAESGYTYYVLASTGSGVEFSPVNAGEIAAGKAFLKVAGGSPVHAFNVVFGDETGISETMRNGDDENMSAIFDLSGRRVAKPVKGLYIVNGKKIMVK